jgi:hypothetical protein
MPSRVWTMTRSFEKIFFARETSPLLATSLGTSFCWGVGSLRTTLTPMRLLPTNHGTRTCPQRHSIPTHPPPMITWHCWGSVVHVFTPAHNPCGQILTGSTSLPICPSKPFLGCILPHFSNEVQHHSVFWRPLPPHNQQDPKLGGRHCINWVEPGLQGYGGKFGLFQF